jgi:hypothetical protein
MNFLNAALQYHAAGFSVFPLRPRSKYPHGDLLPKDAEGKATWKPFQQQRATEEEIRRWWQECPNANIAIATGAISGFIVLDKDSDDADLGELPQTPTSSTGKGTHYLLAHPGGSVRNFARKLPGADLRGDGGYIVAPPSIHPSGRRYEWQISPDDVPLAPVPGWLSMVLETPDTASTTRAVSATEAQTKYAYTALAGEQSALKAAQNGSRNNQLNNAALKLGGLVGAGVLSRSVVEAALEETALAIGLNQREVKNTIRSGIDAGIKEPRKIPELKLTATDDETGNNDTSRPKKRAPSSQQIRDDLQSLGYTFRYNTVTLTIEVNGEPISDAIEATIRMRMRDEGYKNVSAVADVYTSLAHQQSYNPIRDYLDSLTWNSEPHISRFASHFTCLDPPITYANGQTSNLFYTYLYRWMVGAVAKVYQHAQNMMLVLVGPQNAGKSTVAKWLCSPLPGYFVAQPIQTDDKDSVLRLAKNFIWEVDELDGTIRKSDVAALKGFITRDEVVARPAYARRDIHAPALASMIGTVNKGSGFLADATGNRRFYVAEVSAINWNYTKLDVNQMWAQAVHDYKEGVANDRKPWLLQPSERAAQTETNKGHEVRTLLDDWIDMDFYLDGGPDVGMTAAQIVDHLRAREHFLTGHGRAQAMEVADAFIKRGVDRKQTTIDGVRGTYYLGVIKNVS